MPQKRQGGADQGAADETGDGADRGERRRISGDEASRRRGLLGNHIPLGIGGQTDVLRTLLAWVEVLRPALTRPGYANALVVFTGWVLTQGRHAITEALVLTDVARRRHHERFHRFFSRGTWSPDAIGRRALINA